MTELQTYLSLFGALCVGIGLGWAMGSLTPARHGWAPFAVLAFWIVVGVAIAHIPPSWLLEAPVSP